MHNELLDFSAMEQYRIDCKQEVTLNHRLAPDVYIAMIMRTLNACQ
ncbi:MAG: hypothetical protein ACYDDO_02745 [Acidiferrobacterales bacterium]